MGKRVKFSPAQTPRLRETGEGETVIDRDGAIWQVASEGQPR